MLPGGGGAQCDISTQIAIGGAHTRNDPTGMGIGHGHELPFPGIGSGFLLGKSQIAHQFPLCEMGAAVAQNWFTAGCVFVRVVSLSTRN